MIIPTLPDIPGEHTAIAIICVGEYNLEALPLALRALAHTGTECPIYVICAHYERDRIAPKIDERRHRLLAIETPRSNWPQHQRGLLMAEASRLAPEHGQIICATPRTLFLIDPAILAAELDMRAEAITDAGQALPLLALPLRDRAATLPTSVLRLPFIDCLISIRHGFPADAYGQMLHEIPEKLHKLPMLSGICWARLAERWGCLDIDPAAWNRPIDQAIGEDTAALHYYSSIDMPVASSVLDAVLVGNYRRRWHTKGAPA